MVTIHIMDLLCPPLHPISISTAAKVLIGYNMLWLHCFSFHSWTGLIAEVLLFIDNAVEHS